MSSKGLTVLMTFLFSGYAVPYYIATLYIAQLPGDKFVNGMLFGVSEAISVLICGVMMRNMSDTTVIFIIFCQAVGAYTIYIFLGNIGNLCYVGMILLV